MSAAHGIDNSGTTYAQGNVDVTTPGALTNSGVLAAQHDTIVNAGSIALTGVLGAGVNGDGSLAQSGDLNVSASGAVTATGRNVVGSKESMTSNALDLAGSVNSANGAIVLAADSGDLNLSRATTTAGSTLDARWRYADQRQRRNVVGWRADHHGRRTLQPQRTDRVGRRARRARGTNREFRFHHGVTSPDRVGRAVSVNSDTFASNANMTLTAGTTLTNAGQFGAARALILSAATFDNSHGTTSADQFTLHAANLVNHGGTITQTGPGATTLDVTGTLDNSAGGTMQTNSADLTLAPAALINDGGTIVTTGQIVARAGSLSNLCGVLAAQGNIVANVTGGIDNTQGAFRSLASMSLTSGGVLTNTNGLIQSGTGATGDTSTLGIRAADVDNTNGLVSSLGTGDARVHGGSRIVNTSGIMTNNGAVAVETDVLLNTQNGQLSGANVAVDAHIVDNSNGQIGSVAGSIGDVSVRTLATVINTSGHISATRDLFVASPLLTGGGAYSAMHDVAVFVRGDFSPTQDLQFNAGHGLTFTLPGTFTNSALLAAIDRLSIDAGAIVNSDTMMAGGTLSTHSHTLDNTGVLVGGSVSLNANSRISNTGPTALIGATHSDGVLEVLAPVIENRDDTTATDTQATTAIYGLGKVVLAGGKDANGTYRSADRILNSSALIASAGDMQLNAAKVTNTRTTMTTTGLNQPVAGIARTTRRQHVRMHGGRYGRMRG